MALALCVATPAARAQRQASSGEQLVFEQPRDPLFDAADLERVQRRRADAMRNEVEIGNELRRREVNYRMDRVGRSNWRMW